MKNFIEKNYDDIKALLSDRNYDINTKHDEEGNTLLHYAAYNNDYLLTKELLKKGADINAKNHAQNTTLHLIVSISIKGTWFKTERERIVKFLLENGADKESRNGTEETPLHLAVLNDVNLINLLLNEGAVIDSRNIRQETPLHYALYLSDNVQLTMTLLLEHGANINAVNIHGETLIHRLIALKDTHPNYLQLLQFLLEKGADLEIRDHQGRTAIECHPAPEIKKILLEAGAINSVPSADDLPPDPERVFYFLQLALEQNTHSRLKILLTRYNNGDISTENSAEILLTLARSSTPKTFEIFLNQTLFNSIQFRVPRFLMKIINWLKINAPLTRWILWFKATPLIATESRNELKYIISNFYQLAQQNNNQPLVNYLITKYPNEFLQEANPKELPHAVDENSLEKAPSISVPSNHLTFKSSPNTDCELQESKTRVRDNRCCS